MLITLFKTELFKNNNKKLPLSIARVIIMPLTMKCEVKKENDTFVEKCSIMDGDQQIATIDYQRKGKDPKEMDVALNFKSNIGGIQTFESFAKTQTTEDLKRIREIDAEMDKLLAERKELVPKRFFNPFFFDFMF